MAGKKKKTDPPGPAKPPRPKPPGKPTALTDAVHKALVSAVLLGANQKTACLAAGITPRTFQNWRKFADAGGKRYDPHVRLFRELKSARGQFVTRHLNNIRKQAEGQAVTERRTIKHADGSTETVERFAAVQWTASAWLLERCDSLQFGRKDMTTVKADGKDAEGVPQLVIVRGPRHVPPPADDPTAGGDRGAD